MSLLCLASGLQPPTRQCVHSVPYITSSRTLESRVWERMHPCVLTTPPNPPESCCLSSFQGRCPPTAEWGVSRQTVQGACCCRTGFGPWGERPDLLATHSFSLVSCSPPTQHIFSSFLSAPTLIECMLCAGHCTVDFRDNKCRKVGPHPRTI